MNICELLENNSNALDADEPPSNDIDNSKSKTQTQLDQNQTTITVNTTDTDSKNSAQIDNGATFAGGGGDSGEGGREGRGNESEMFALFSDLDQNKHQNQQLQLSDSQTDNLLTTTSATNSSYTSALYNNENNTPSLDNQSLNYILSSSLFSSSLSSSSSSSSSSNESSDEANNASSSSSSTHENNNDQQNNNSNNYSNVLTSIENNSIDFGNSMLSAGNEDEFSFDRLNPFEKLCSLCDNPTPSNMESASKYVVPALEFCATLEDYVRVFSYLRKFSFFPDILLRSLWLEQIQSVIQYIHQEGENIPIDFKDFSMSHELATLISSLMLEPTYQVKKYATASLLCIVERRLLDNDQIEKMIIPSLLNLIKENNEDFHIDCVSLFGKLAPLIGRDLTTKYFLEPFCRLCSSPVFHTRKACASNITELANIVVMEEVEKFLLPHFCEFMKDQVWAIRKVCADMFSSFASKCSRKIREQVLTECFIRLLDDTSRWVKISAYKSLGSFIATFVKDKNEEETKKESPETEVNNLETKQEDLVAQLSDVKVTETATLNSDQDISKKVNKLLIDSQLNENELKKKETDDKDSEYSNFMFWRNSLPSLDDSSLSNSSKTEKEQEKPTDDSNLLNKSSTSVNSNNSSSSIGSNINNSNANSIQNNSINYISSFYSSTNSLSMFSNIIQQQQQSQNTIPAHLRPIDYNQLSEELKQDIVPPILLSYFITMVEMNAQNSLDAEMNYNCAFNFPAIVLTIGLPNWKFVKNLYKRLSEDNSWKVRQTLAYSIHEIAIILGTENTQSELVPVFDSFIKDVDEVRMGIVSNLSKFLRVLSIDYRKSYMPKLNDFLKMDNQRNWRFRNELGLQIADFVHLFPTDCIAEFIQPVTFILALDKVAEVRLTALKALTLILKQFELASDDPYNKNYRRNFIDDVIRTFANNNKWSFRQLYVFLCDSILNEKAYSDINTFCADFLPKLFSFRNDKVPNIRVSLAKVISNHMLNTDYFQNENTQFQNELEMTLQYLNGDRDEDVKYCLKTSHFSKNQTADTPATNLESSLSELPSTAY